MVEDREDIYEYKMNTSDWPYLFENAKKELAGFSPVSRKQGAYLTKDDFLVVIRVFEWVNRRVRLFPEQLEVYQKLMKVYYGN